APAKMIGNPRCLGALDKFLEPPQMLAIRLFRRTEIHRHAVLHDFVLFQNLIEDLQRAPAIDHEIFRNDLEPIDHRFTAQDVIVVRRAQPNPDPILRKSIKPIRRHYRIPPNLRNHARGRRLPPAPAQTAIVSWTLPLRLLLGHLAAVGRAAALALARVLALAAIVTGLAAALALARVLALAAIVTGLAAALALAAVLALTGVLFFCFLVGLGIVLRGGGR